MRFKSQLSRMKRRRWMIRGIIPKPSQTFSTGLSSRHRGGSDIRVLLSGMTSSPERCHPA